MKIWTKRHTLTKAAVLKDFREIHLPIIREQCEQDRRIDYAARRESWNNYVDSLCEDTLISQSQADTWTNPY